MNDTTVTLPMSEDTLRFYRTYFQQNGFNLTDEEIQSHNNFEVLGDSMLPRFSRGTLLVAVKRSRETLPQPGKVIVISLLDEPNRACAGRIKEVTEESITISHDNPAFTDVVFAWEKVEAIYEVLWYWRKLID